MSRREPKGAKRRLLDAKQARSASKLGKKKENSQLAASKVSHKTCKEEAASVGLARDPVEGCKH